MIITFTISYSLMGQAFPATESPYLSFRFVLSDQNSLSPSGLNGGQEIQLVGGADVQWNNMSTTGEN